jgi:hypothetical protein
LRTTSRSKSKALGNGGILLEKYLNDGTLTTYVVVTRDGRTDFISAYCESDAYQQAQEFAEPEGIQSFEEM